MIDLPPAEVRCLEAAIHYEAKGESFAGKLAVGNVVLNRVAAPDFPKSVCAVVKQKKQFSWYRGDDTSATTPGKRRAKRWRPNAATRCSSTPPTSLRRGRRS